MPPFSPAISVAPQLSAVSGPCAPIKGGFYAKPGANVVLISYSYTRPGVMYKNETTGQVKYGIDVDAKGTYALGFDRDEKAFVLEKENA